MLLGSYGLERQGKARDTEMQAAAQQEGESLAAILAESYGFKIDPSTAKTLTDNPTLLKHVLAEAQSRAHPAEPIPEKMSRFSALSTALGERI